MFGGIRLLVIEGAKGDKHGGINGNGIIEERANYLLHKVNGLWGQQGIGVPNGGFGIVIGIVEEL